MSFSLVAHTNGGGVDGGSTSAANTTGATLLVAASTGIKMPTGLTDSKGNLWAVLPSVTFSGNITQMYCCLSPIVGTGHTFTISGTGIYTGLVVAAFSSTTQAYQSTQVGTTASSTTTISPGSLTPSSTADLMVTALGYNLTSATSPTINSGYAVAEYRPTVGGTSVAAALAFLSPASTTALSPTWTLPASDSPGAQHLRFTGVNAGGGSGGGGSIFGSSIIVPGRRTS